MRVYIALVHYPVYNKNGKIVATCITGFDLHDIARSAATFGIKRYYVVNPMPAQQEFAGRIVDAWKKDEAAEVNWTRAEALKIVEIKSDLKEAIEDIERIEGQKPKVVMTSAKAEKGLTFKGLKEKIAADQYPYLVVFGTGWGMTEEYQKQGDYLLQAIKGPGEYNHLSVRSAAAVILDQLMGKGEQ